MRSETFYAEGHKLARVSLVLTSKWPECRSILDTVAQFPNDLFSLEVTEAHGKLRLKLMALPVGH